MGVCFASSPKDKINLHSTEALHTGILAVLCSMRHVGLSHWLPGAAQHPVLSVLSIPECSCTMVGSYSSSSTCFIPEYELSLHIGMCYYQLSNSQRCSLVRRTQFASWVFFMLYRLASDSYRGRILLEQILFRVDLLNVFLSFAMLSLLLSFENQFCNRIWSRHGVERCHLSPEGLSCLCNFIPNSVTSSCSPAWTFSQ